MKLKLIFVLSLIIVVTAARAGTFTVTTNADNGPGSLREAITQANANGTAVTDFILFNIADQSEAGRTINLQSELPTLTSNITIDGTSQPGTSLGISNARITLYLDHYTSIPFTFLFIHNASAVSVYGICFKFFDNPAAGGGLNYAIGLRNVSQITVGAPGKGNLFSAVRAGISNNYWNYFAPDSAKDITIQSNVFGLSSSNQMVSGGLIDLKGAANITIGGPSAAEGNLHINASIYLVEINNSASAFFVKIQNSRININWDESTYYYFNSGKLTLWGNITDDSLTTKTWLLDNMFCGTGLTGIELFQMYHRAVMQGNELGLNAAGNACQNSPYHISVIPTCKNLVIGGYSATEQNIIHGDIYVPKHGVHVLQNQISGIILNQGTAAPDPFIKMTEYDNNLIRGVSNGNAKIQLYSTECQGNNACFLKKYYDVTWADAAGNWSYPYTTTTPNLVATATISDSSTSAFTAVNVDHFNYRVIKDATCGKSNGSITGIIIYQGTHFGWYNNNNQLVSTDTNLVNVPAGTYYLRVSNGANGCTWSVGLTINDISPPITLNPAPQITNASCGQSNGIINHTTYSYFRNIWYNNLLDSIGNGQFVNNLAPGNYFLRLLSITDTGCHRLYGPFNVANVSGPSVNTNTVLLTPATCGNNNGAIDGITSSNVSGVPFIVWVDSLNNIFGNALNASNLPAGRYRLKFKDASTCDTIITQYFTIISQGIINLNTNNIVVTGSDCGASNGSIKQIMQTGATLFQWINAAGAVVGTNIDLTGVPAGKYILKCTNGFGCTAQTDSITMMNAPFIPNLNMLQFISQPGKCDRNDGYYTVGNFPNASLYSFYWVDSLQPATIIGNSLSLTGINSGTYFMFARNAAGCEEKVVVARIPYQEPVKVDAGGVQISAATCNLANGSIKGLTNIAGSGLAPFTYRWFDNNLVTVANQQQLVNAISGSYKLAITDANACADTSSSLVIANTNVSLTKPVYQDQSVRIGTTATLSVQNPQTGTYYLFDSPLAVTPLSQNSTGIFTGINIVKDITYYISFASGTCTSERTAVKIKAFSVTEVFVPNAFTPNNDSKNDVLRPLITGLAEVDRFMIYNKYGEVVFSTRDAATGWDGTYKGKLQPGGTYVWIFNGRYTFSGRAINEQGSFVLIR